MSSAAHPQQAKPLTTTLEGGAVADAMHPGIVSCPPDASSTTVAQTMAAHRLHCVFVMHPGFDGSGEPYVWGIVSDLDLMRSALHPGERQTAGSLAGQPLVSVKPTTPLSDACALMVKHGVTHLVVIDSSTRRPIGVLSTTDISAILGRSGT